MHLEERNDLPQERLGRGGVHHVAFRVDNDTELKQWIERIRAVQLPNSGFVDRFYFRSLYFREPNGILFELATDGRALPPTSRWSISANPLPCLRSWKQSGSRSKLTSNRWIPASNPESNNIYTLAQLKQLRSAQERSCFYLHLSP